MVQRKCKNIGNKTGKHFQNTKAYAPPEQYDNLKALEIWIIQKYEKLKMIIGKVTPINYKEIISIEKQDGEQS